MGVSRINRAWRITFVVLGIIAIASGVLGLVNRQPVRAAVLLPLGVVLFAVSYVVSRGGR